MFQYRPHLKFKPGLEFKSMLRSRLNVLVYYDSFYVPMCQHDRSYIDGWSQIQVHSDEWTRVHSAWSSLVVTHPCIDRFRCTSTELALVATQASKMF